MKTHALCILGVLGLWSASEAIAKDYDVVVKGRCGYVGKDGKFAPIAGTRVQVWDDDRAPRQSDWVKGCAKGLGNECVGEMSTRADGTFEIRGRAGDVVDLGGVFK